MPQCTEPETVPNLCLLYRSADLKRYLVIVLPSVEIGEAREAQNTNPSTISPISGLAGATLLRPASDGTAGARLPGTGAGEVRSTVLTSGGGWKRRRRRRSKPSPHEIGLGFQELLRPRRRPGSSGTAEAVAGGRGRAAQVAQGGGGAGKRPHTALGLGSGWTAAAGRGGGGGALGQRRPAGRGARARGVGGRGPRRRRRAGSSCNPARLELGLGCCRRLERLRRRRRRRRSAGKVAGARGEVQGEGLQEAQSRAFTQPERREGERKRGRRRKVVAAAVVGRPGLGRRQPGHAQQVQGKERKVAGATRVARVRVSHVDPRFELDLRDLRRETDALTRALQVSLSPSSSISSPSHPSSSSSAAAAALLLRLVNNPHHSAAAAAAAGAGPRFQMPPAVASRRISKRRSRASKRLPTTYISVDPANFRRMVQEVTGVRFGEGDGPAEPAPARPDPSLFAADRAASGLPPQPSCGLPTLDTSAFLLDRAGSELREDGSVGPDLGGPGFEFDPFPCFPTLESWGGV
uniref:VQ domain-containing protein n=1 Tax=Ananas comosus var. bracteatus TaxID=296719 RepID=A0A6V7NFT2_ANACO|nr:unnamed protein product [Ananas comosus var. bracteatus]